MSDFKDKFLEGEGELFKQDGKVYGDQRDTLWYLMKDTSMEWAGDEYLGMFKEARVKNIKCAEAGATPTGFGPRCEFQSIGIAAEHQCVVEERALCIGSYVAMLYNCAPRDRFNCPERAYTNRWYGFYGSMLSDTQALTTWQKQSAPDGQPRENGYPAWSPECTTIDLSTFSKANLCCGGASGEPCMAQARVRLKQCMKEVDYTCGCKNCNDPPKEEEINKFGGPRTTVENPDNDDKTIDPVDGGPSAFTLQEFTVSSADIPIPVTYGVVPLKGNIIWLGNTRVVTTAVPDVLSPDSAGAAEKTNTDTLVGDFIVGLCEGTIGGVSKIKFGTRVVYRASLPSLATSGEEAFVEDASSLLAFYRGAETPPRASFEIYQGDPDGVPPDVYSGGTAHRGLAYILFRDMPLSQAGGSLPDITVEVYTRAEPAASVVYSDTALDDDFLQYNEKTDTFAVASRSGTSAQITTLDRRTLRPVKTFPSAQIAKGSIADTNVFGFFTQESDGTGRSVTRFVGSPDDVSFGVNSSAVVGHGSLRIGSQLTPNPVTFKDHLSIFWPESISLAAVARPGRGPNVTVYPSFMAETLVGVITTSSRFDDVSRMAINATTRAMMDEHRYFGNSDRSPAECLVSCLDFYENFCLTEAIMAANDGDPLGTNPADPVMYDACLSSGSDDCSAQCAASRNVLDAVSVGGRIVVSPVDGEDAYEEGHILFLVPEGVMSGITVSFLKLHSTTSTVEYNKNLYPQTLPPIPSSLWDAASGAYIATVFRRRVDDTHVIFIKTTGSDDYAFQWNCIAGTSAWGVKISGDARLPNRYSAGDRRLNDYPTSDYSWYGPSGKLVTIDLSTGEVITGLYTVHDATGAQFYDPRDKSIAYVSGAGVVKSFPHHVALGHVTVEEVVRDVLIRSTLDEQIAVSGLSDEIIIGALISVDTDVVTLLDGFRDMYGVSVSGNGFNVGVSGAVTRDVSVGETSLSRQFSKINRTEGERLDYVSIESINLEIPGERAAATVRRDGSRSSSNHGRVVSVPVVLDAGEAVTRGHYILDNANDALEAATFTLGPAAVSAVPGDVVSIDGVPYRIEQLTEVPFGEISVHAVKFYGAVTAVVQPAAPELALVNKDVTAVMLFTGPLNDAAAKNIVNGKQPLYVGYDANEPTTGTRVVYANMRRAIDASRGSASITDRITAKTLNRPAHGGVTVRPPKNYSFLRRDDSATMDILFDREESANLLTNADATAIINDRTKNLIITGGEMIQFTTATKLAPRVVRVSGLYRGRQGTDYAIWLGNKASRAYYYTPDTLRPYYIPPVQVQTLKQATLHVAGTYDQYPPTIRVNADGSRLWSIQQIKAEVLGTAPFSDVKFTWHPTSVYGEREEENFTPFMPYEKFTLRLWSYFWNGQSLPTDYVDLAMATNSVPGPQRYESTVTGEREVIVPAEEFQRLGTNVQSGVIYVTVEQINTITNQRGLPGHAVIPGPLHVDYPSYIAPTGLG